MAEAAPTRYAESISFLLSQVGARSAQLFAERLAPLGISPRACAILSNLGAGEPQTQQQLADSLEIHRNNMVGLIDELEAAGWVRRERSVQDRRAFQIQLTVEGRAIVEAVNELIPALDDALAGGLSGADRHALTGLLGSVAEQIGLEPAVHPNLARRPRP